MNNLIDRRGQKVICIVAPDVWKNLCCELSFPVRDQIYTVADFAEIEGLPGIFLMELPPVTCSCSGLSGAAWPLFCFRPFDTRETDISALTRLVADPRLEQSVC